MANTKITSRVIADNSVGIDALNVTDGTNGQYLQTDGAGTLSFSTVSGTTINNNADNRIITGSGTANTLEGESGLTYNGSTLDITGSGSLSGNLRIQAASSSAKLTVGDFGDTARAAQFHGGNILIDGGAATELIIGDGNVAYMSIQTTDDATAMNIRDFSGNSDLVTIKRSSGNVGIGTDNPDAPLHVEATNASMLLSNSGRTQYWRMQNVESGDALTFNLSDASEKLRIQSGGGISFNGDTAEANALDDYEEGTHTTSITCSVSGTVSLYTNINKLNYVKIGKMVHVQGMLTAESVSSPSGYFTVSLPFNISSWGGTYAGRGTGTIWLNTGSSNNVADYVVLLVQGESSARVYLGDNIGVQSDSANNIGANDDIYVGLTYTTN
jgi:hypothetical protein